jgi:hypothetical protein
VGEGECRKPTVDEKALDADASLAASSRFLGQTGAAVIVATTNVGHFARFVDAGSWREIS